MDSCDRHIILHSYTSGRPDPRNFQTVDPDTYSFPGYFTAEYLQATRPWEEAASPPRREGPSSLPSPPTTPGRSHTRTGASRTSALHDVLHRRYPGTPGRGGTDSLQLEK